MKPLMRELPDGTLVTDYDAEYWRDVDMADQRYDDEMQREPEGVKDV